jgi:hypothetical protein
LADSDEIIGCPILVRPAKTRQKLYYGIIQGVRSLLFKHKSFICKYLSLRVWLTVTKKRSDPFLVLLPDAGSGELFVD